MTIGSNFQIVGSKKKRSNEQFIFKQPVSAPKSSVLDSNETGVKFK